ncbi:MAG TPA: rhamnogalacturonan acetylesterase [Opitutaceae bacterium]|nr:rhamnogalacturonan acetylesterase [Opitutaceae bacterium]
MKRLLLLVVLFSVARAAEPAPLRFAFGSSPTASGTRVAGDALFSVERGFGFEPGGTLATQPACVRSDQPFLFSAAVDEGNYLVTVTLGDPAGASDTTVKAESRRLVLEKIVTAAGQLETRTFAVNVRNAKVPPPPLNAPGNDHVELNDRERTGGPGGALVLHWDDKLTVEFDGPHPAVAAIEIKRADHLPTVFLAGDSTVTDQPREPGASWGQMLPRFLKPDVVVANHAESGETLKSFITELRLDKLLSQMKRGDYLFIQFGHNDEKQSWPQTYVEAGTTYKAYLKAFVAEARRRGATPVLVSPMQRRQFDNAGKIRNSHGDYPAAVREVANEEHVAFIDLSSISAAFYEALGPAKSPLAFSGFGERRDATHHDNYGAYELAKAIAQGIRDNHLDLAKSLVDDFKGFDPAHPDNVDTFDLAASPGRTNVAPRGN